MKENVIIGRLIPAGKQYRKLHNHVNEDDKSYFDSDDELVDI